MTQQDNRPDDVYFGIHSDVHAKEANIDLFQDILHSLLETQHSADLLNEPMVLGRMDRYKLLVVPEQTHLSETLKTALEAFARRGGTLLFSGAHVAEEAGDLLGVRPAGTTIPFTWDASTRTARLQIASVGIHDIVVVA